MTVQDPVVDSGRASSSAMPDNGRNDKHDHLSSQTAGELQVARRCCVAAALSACSDTVSC